MTLFKGILLFLLTLNLFSAEKGCLKLNYLTHELDDELLKANAQGDFITKKGIVIQTDKTSDAVKLKEIQASLDSDSEFLKLLNSVTPDDMSLKLNQQMKADALRAIKVGEILAKGPGVGNRIYIINNGMVKRLNSVLGFQEANLYLDKIKTFVAQKFKENGIKKPFFEDFRSIQFTAKAADQQLIENSVIKPLRNYLFEEFSKNPLILKKIGDKRQISEVIQAAVSFGMGETYETATFASRIGTTKKLRESIEGSRFHNKIYKTDESVIKMAIDYTHDLKTELQKRAPTFFDSTGNALDTTLVKLMRKHGNKSLAETQKFFPPEMAKQLTEESLFLVRDYMRSVNVIDFLPPKLLDPTSAQKLLQLLKEKKYEEATKIYKLDKRNESMLFTSQLGHSDTEAVIALDLVNLGGKNFKAMEEQMSYMHKISTTRSKVTEQELGQLLNQTLKPVDLYLDDLITNATKILDEKKIRYDKMLAGDDLFIRIKSPLKDIKELNEVTEKIQYVTSKSPYFEAGKSPFRTSVVYQTGNLQPSDMLVRIDKMTDTLKAYEEKELAAAKAISMGDKVILIPPKKLNEVQKERWNQLFLAP